MFHSSRKVESVYMYYSNDKKFRETGIPISESRKMKPVVFPGIFGNRDFDSGNRGLSKQPKFYGKPRLPKKRR